MTDADGDVRAELRAYIEENFLYTAPGRRARRRGRLPRAGRHRLARLRRARRGGPGALRDRRSRTSRSPRRTSARSTRSSASSSASGRVLSTAHARRGPARRAARARPDTVALVAASGASPTPSWTASSTRFAAGLAELGVARATASRSCYRTASTLRSRSTGTLRAGAAFIAAEPDDQGATSSPTCWTTPAARWRSICDAEARAAIATVRPPTASGGIPVDRRSSRSSSRRRPTARPPARAAATVDLAALIYTSGSTGGPKGVTLTHRNMAFVAGSIVEYLELSDADRILCVLPLSFGYGLYQLLICVRGGATLVLEAASRFPGRVFKLLEQQRITGAAGRADDLSGALDLRGLAERELPHLRFLTNAGAGAPAHDGRRGRADLPRRRALLDVRADRVQARLLPAARAGRRAARPPSGSRSPAPRSGSRTTTASVPPGEVGELIVRGAHVMQGYWEDPEATAAAAARPLAWERVLATGDLFRRDEDGFLYFVGRTRRHHQVARREGGTARGRGGPLRVPASRRPPSSGFRTGCSARRCTLTSPPTKASSSIRWR